MAFNAGDEVEELTYDFTTLPSCYNQLKKAGFKDAQMKGASPEPSSDQVQKFIAKIGDAALAEAKQSRKRSDAFYEELQAREAAGEQVPEAERAAATKKAQAAAAEADKLEQVDASTPEDALRSMSQLAEEDMAAAGKVTDALVEAHAEVLSGEPSAELIRALPHRVRVRFLAVTQKELTDPSRATAGSSS